MPRIFPKKFGQKKNWPVKVVKNAPTFRHQIGHLDLNFSRRDALESGFAGIQIYPGGGIGRYRTGYPATFH